MLWWAMTVLTMHLLFKFGMCKGMVGSTSMGLLKVDALEV